MSDTAAIARSIASALGRPFVVAAAEPAGGGCINEALVVRGEGERYFVKLNRSDRAGMFAAEADGLRELSAAGAIRVPQPICSGVNGRAFLVLEYLPLGAERGASLERLGHQLAALHRRTQTKFGWRRDNTIGSTPQANTEHEDWIEFWRSRRLLPQLALATDNGHARALARGARLAERLHALYTDYRPAPSLLHGDLWSGNYGVLADGEPVIFDPAVYYGDREADLAMTELFGGFSARFYAAYNETWPLDPGYEVRKDLYNLYHVLNHLNLFGGGYLAQATRLIDRLLSETG